MIVYFVLFLFTNVPEWNGICPSAQNLNSRKFFRFQNIIIFTVNVCYRSLNDIGTITIAGKYSWQLLFDIANTQISGFMRRKFEALYYNYNSLVRDVKEASLGISSNSKIEAGVPIEVVKHRIRDRMTWN